MKKIVTTLILATTIFTTTLQGGCACFCNRKTLDLSETENLTTEGLEKILKKGGSKLKTINLNGQTDLLKVGIIGTYCKNLKALYLASTSINNVDLKYILKNNPNLVEISLAECFNLINFCSIIIEHCGNLKELNISHTSVTPEGIRSLNSAYPLYKPVKLITVGCISLQ